MTIIEYITFVIVMLSFMVFAYKIIKDNGNKKNLK